jgi:hypothetical protein
MTNEAFSRVRIDAPAVDDRADRLRAVAMVCPAVSREHQGCDSGSPRMTGDTVKGLAGPVCRAATEGRASGGPGDRNRRSLSVIDAKKATVYPANGAAQPRAVKLRAGVWGTGENGIRNGAP